MEFAKFVEWAFYLFVSGSFLAGLRILSSLKTSIEQLNVNVAIVIEKTATHEKTLDRHENEIQKLRDR